MNRLETVAPAIQVAAYSRSIGGLGGPCDACTASEGRHGFDGGAFVPIGSGKRPQGQGPALEVDDPGDVDAVKSRLMVRTRRVSDCGGREKDESPWPIEIHQRKVRVHRSCSSAHSGRFSERTPDNRGLFVPGRSFLLALCHPNPPPQSGSSSRKPRI